MAAKIGDVTVTWLGHAGIMLEGSKRIYIDPYNIHSKDKQAADILLITHSHYDHLSIPDIEQIITPKTAVVCPPDCQSKLAKFKIGSLHVLSPNDVITVEGIRISGVAAYNKHKQFHPSKNEWLGYVVTLDDVRIYHSGDSDHTPEMDEVQCDVALLPISGTYVMTADEAAAAANAIKPQVSIPIHWGDFIGTKEDAATFKRHVKGTALILEKE